MKEKQMASTNQEMTPAGRRLYGTTEPGEGVHCARNTPLSEKETEEVVNLIADAHESRGSIVLPERLRTRDWDSVTRVLLNLDRRRNLSPVGWKIGAASESVRAVEGMPEPSPGRLYEGTIFPSGSSLDEELFINYRNNECEFAFTMGHDLPPRDTPYSEDEVTDAISTMSLVIEVGDMVFSDWYGAAGYFGTSLDNGGGGALVQSLPIDDWQQLDLPNTKIDVYVNDTWIKSGLGEAAMGHPVTSLTWMVNWLSARDITLAKGEIVSTGTCTGHCFVAPGDHVRAVFDGIGEVNVRYA